MDRAPRRGAGDTPVAAGTGGGSRKYRPAMIRIAHRHAGACPRRRGRAAAGAGAGVRSRPLLDRALNIAEELLGTDHPSTLATRDQLAYWLGEAGQPGQAATQIRDLLSDRLRILGPDHPSTLTARGILAYMLGEAGQPAQAAIQLRELLDDFLRVPPFDP